MTQIRRPFLLILPLVGSALFAGCASIPEVYYPQKTGPILAAEMPSDIQARITADSETAVKGRPIQFSVELLNVGEDELLIPRRPDILFAWTYANGKRDNFIAEVPAERFYVQDDLVRLGPGDSMQVTVPVKTYYFRRLGITEFRAIVKGPRNANPALGNVWEGYVMSNRYGVMVTDKRRDYASLR